VSVTVETTTTQADRTQYGTGPGMMAQPGYRFASVEGTVTNSTDATVAFPEDPEPVAIHDATGTVLKPMGAMRVLFAKSGRPVLPQLVGHHYVSQRGIAPGAAAFYIVSYQRPLASRGPVTTIWNVGGRTFRFTLPSP
jgi:hypothetical protein